MGGKIPGIPDREFLVALPTLATHAPGPLP